MFYKKGLISLVMACIISCNLLFSNVVLAKTNLNPQTSSCKTEQVLEDNKLIEDYNGNNRAIVMPNEFWGKVLNHVFGSIVDELISDLWNEVKSWISSSKPRYGGEANQDCSVKIDGYQFNHKDPANWCGDNKTNSYTLIRKLQNALIDAGYNPGAVDGEWGPKTKAAVKRFQADQGLTTDGIVGTKTWNNLCGKKR